MMEDPEGFLDGLHGKRVILDEVHRLPNPSELLKIAADHYKTIKIVATGYSTLQASSKFRDTLTGRKEEVWLTPMNDGDLVDFQKQDLKHRLREGGLPPFFLGEAEKGRDCQEWMDSYWAKDIQELFHLERHSSFQRFLELILANSGGIFEATKYAAPCEISRTTIANYLSVLEATRVAHVIKPFSSHSPTEIISAPKVYGFDTGFVCYYRGWEELRPADYGNLWEHLALNEIASRGWFHKVRYWRDKRGHEVDFILARGPSRTPLAIECKWKADGFEIQSLKSFRERYPKGENWIVCSDVDKPFRRREVDLALEFIGLSHLSERLSGA